MMEISSREFCKLTVQEAADILLEKLTENLENDKEYSCAKLYGKHDDKMYELCMVMRCKDE